MLLDMFLNTVINEPLNVEFSQTLETIEENYRYTPTTFSNGDIVNKAGSNEGSCKIFAFARLHNLTEAQTLACFGAYYRTDVLGNPESQDHANIRNFIRYGWQGVSFEGEALEPLNIGVS